MSVISTVCALDVLLTSRLVRPRLCFVALWCVTSGPIRLPLTHRSTRSVRTFDSSFGLRFDHWNVIKCHLLHLLLGVFVILTICIAFCNVKSLPTSMSFSRILGEVVPNIVLSRIISVTISRPRSYSDDKRIICFTALYFVIKLITCKYRVQRRPDVFLKAFIKHIQFLGVVC